MFTIAANAAAILLVFYLVMFVKWNIVRRPLFILIGAGTLVLSLIGGFFSVSNANWSNILQTILSSIGALGGFVCGFLGCYGSKLPAEHTKQPK